MLTCLRGIAVRGPLVDGKHAYVLAADWIGRPPQVARDRALAELARRYLRSHAPADDRDLAKWAGLPLRDARAGLQAIAGELVELGEGQLSLKGEGDATPPRVCLLDQWDPILVGWRSRAVLLEHYPRRDQPEAHFHKFAYVGARAVATWSARQKAVTVSAPFVLLQRGSARALEEDAADVARFLATAA